MMYKSDCQVPSQFRLPLVCRKSPVEQNKIQLKLNIGLIRDQIKIGKLTITGQMKALNSITPMVGPRQARLTGLRANLKFRSRILHVSDRICTAVRPQTSLL